MYRFATYKEQYRANLRLAFPVVLTQVGQILTQVADNLMVGRYGRRIVWRLGLLHPLHRGRGGRAGTYAPRRRALRPQGARAFGPAAPQRHPLLHDAGLRRRSAAVCRHTAALPPRAARRGGRHGHPLLPHAGLQHALPDALLRLQAVPRRGRQHARGDGRDDFHQPLQHRLQRPVHLRQPRISRDGGPKAPVWARCSRAPSPRC